MRRAKDRNPQVLLTSIAIAESVNGDMIVFLPRLRDVAGVDICGESEVGVWRELNALSLPFNTYLHVSEVLVLF